MFLAPLIRWLTQHDNPRVAFGITFVLACAALGLAAIGFAIHQPAMIRIAILLFIASVAVLVIRSRRGHTGQRDGTGQRDPADQ